jgi:AcrR family transcriptional regulator
MFPKSDKALWSERDPRSIRSREALRKAFAELLETRSPDQITIRDITAKSEVGYTTFFRHYSDKDDILLELITDEVRRFMEASRPGFSVGDTALGFLGVCQYVHRHRAFWTNLLTGGAAATVKEVLVALSQSVTAQRNLPSGFLPADLGVILSVSSVFEVLTWWLRQTEPISAEHAAEMIDYALAPLSRGSFESVARGSA